LSNLDRSQPDFAAQPLKKKPRHRGWFVALLGLLIGIGGLIAGRLGHLYAVFDVFSQLGVQFIAMALGFSFGMFFTRYKGLVGIATTIALLGAYGLWPHVVSDGEAQNKFALADGERTIRLVHFNTYKNNADTPAIAAEILRLDGDLVSLVEITSAKFKAIQPLLQTKYPYFYDCDAGRACDNAIVSKQPLSNPEGKTIWEGPDFARVEVGDAATGFVFYSLHMSRFPHSRYQLHQAKVLVGLLEKETRPIIIAGDFNTTPFSRISKLLQEGANLSRVTELPTWPTHLGLPQLSIDHIFLSKEFRTLAVEQIGNAAGSDHYPIVQELAYQPRP
jgi:endonuclease/exonuclease/phosphatase (EEP) superfamily protein YafD